VDLRVHPNFDALRSELPQSRWVYFSTHAHRSYLDFCFQRDDCLVFGSETNGLPTELLVHEKERVLRIPVDATRVRSLNLSTSVGIVLFEALRQLTSQNG